MNVTQVAVAVIVIVGLVVLLGAFASGGINEVENFFIGKDGKGGVIDQRDGSSTIEPFKTGDSNGGSQSDG